MSLLLGDLLAAAAHNSPDRTAITLGEQRMSFAQLDAAANRTAHALRGLGVESGDRVLWWSETSLRAVEVFAAACRIGATFAPTAPDLDTATACDAVAYLRPRLLVASTR